MTVVQIRTTPSVAAVEADLLLDWFEDSRGASTINCSPEFLLGLPVDPVARELFALAAGVYCADKLVHRETQADSWTRSFEFLMAVRDPELWDRARADLEAMLTFLSGDRVTLKLTARDACGAAPPGGQLTMDSDSVCLFSGGLDSLTGAVDLLASDKRLVLVGHHDSSVAVNRQDLLYPHLVARFGQESVERRSLYLRPATPGPEQARSLDASAPETTTRTRSFLFIAAAVAVASAIGPGVPVYMPENGFIGINVPLTAARSGSLSTRTTHPLYIHYYRRVLETLGLEHPIENPFRLKTKGELVAECADLDLLRKLAPVSVSCSHPEAARWHKGKQGNCGSCYPCLIRRAALFRAGWDKAADYDVDALTDTRLLNRRWVSGASVRAVLASLRGSTAPTDVLANGRLPDGEAGAFYDVWQRGRDELRAWLDDGAVDALRRRYA